METDQEMNPGGTKNHIPIEIPMDLMQYLNSSKCDLQHICRVCLSTNKNELHSVTSTKEFKNLAEMFFIMTSIQLNQDGLPSRLCNDCQIEVVHFSKFRDKCEKSDQMLKSVLKGHSVKAETKHINIDMSKINIVKEDIKIEEDPDEFIDHLGNNEDYSEDLKNVLSDDEALCIVQNTIKNEKKFTILSKDTNEFVKELIGSRKRRKQKKPKYSCDSCSEEFPKLNLLKAHEKQHHFVVSIEPFPCAQCKHSFQTENDLQLHRLIHSAGPWKCIACHKQFEDKTPLRRHIQRHMDGKRFACSDCGKRFVEAYALRRHARVHSGQQPDKKHVCHECGKRFIDKGQLMAHSSRHSGVRAWPCAACGKAFPTPRLLASHARVHRPAQYPCRYCDRRFRHESSRNTHHRTHTGEKPYVCSVCGKTFIQNSNMRLHMRTHTGEKPYACTRCDAKFSSGSSLKNHERSHTGERPYKCPICGKGFARLNLKVHMRLHSGEKPFACHVCPKKYANASHLREHCRTHTGERPFECARCDDKFASKKLLIKHLVHHEIKKPKKKTRLQKQNVISAGPPKNTIETYKVQSLHDTFKVQSLPDTFKLQSLSDTFKVQSLPDTFKVQSLPDTFKIQSLSETFKLQSLPENSKVQSIPNEMVQQVTDEIPNAIMELTLGTHETFDMSQELVFQDNNLRTHVIVLGSNTNTVSFVSNEVDGCASGVNIVTVNEIGVSISATDPDDCT